MKNIQVIDSAINCAYNIYSVTSEVFEKIFPNGQDIEFSDDLFARLGDETAQELLSPVWSSRVEKCDVKGVHGTLFYGLDEKKPFYPNKKEVDLDL